MKDTLAQKKYPAIPEFNLSSNTDPDEEDDTGGDDDDGGKTGTDGTGG